MRPRDLLLALGAVILLVCSTAAAANALSSYQFANVVIGQRNFTVGTDGTSRTNLANPYGVTFDSSGNLWVADSNNSRVLRFAPPFIDGMNASLVIGQKNFSGLNPITGEAPSPTSANLAGPANLAFDLAGNLWVADYLNSRVLEFTQPFSSGMGATLVIGQENLTTNAQAVSQTGLHNPFGVAFDLAGNLWVADYLNSRVLEFTKPFSSGMRASLVIGQGGFATNAQMASQTGFFDPTGLTFDRSGNLWVADTGNNRVLEFIPPFSSGMGASLVVGQTDFTTSISVGSKNRLFYPVGVGFDQSGDLWVSDAGNRLLEFSAPFSNGMQASVVIGQPDISSFVAGLDQRDVHGPSGLKFDSSGNLWVADTGNSRIVEFLGMATSSTSTDVALVRGSALANHTASTGLTVTLRGSSYPDKTAINVFSADLSGDPVALPTNLTGARFYDVTIAGTNDGTANVCLSAKDVDSGTTVEFYAAGAWARAEQITRIVGGRVCGDIPVSAISGGFLAEGDPQPIAATPSFALWMPLSLAGVVAAVLAVILVAWKGRRRLNRER